jgi:DNA-directed RNA polymerase subunit L
MKILSDIETGVVSIIFEKPEEKHNMLNVLENMIDDNKSMVFCYYPENLTEEQQKKATKRMAEVEQSLVDQRGNIDDILDEMENNEL